MNRVLILIDNITLLENIFDIVQELKQNDIIVEYRCSYRNNNKYSFLENYGVETIDVKKDTHYLINNYDVIISYHCLQIFPPELVNNKRCVNIHPGYLPYNRGWYPQIFSIIENTSLGATIHEIDCELDNGPIIDRVEVEKNIWDTSLSLYNKIIKAELLLFKNNYLSIIYNVYKTFTVEGNFKVHYKKDFDKLCTIDLNEVATFEEFYNKLRALSHGDFKNAFFLDKSSGKKVFLKLDVSLDN